MKKLFVFLCAWFLPLHVFAAHDYSIHSYQLSLNVNEDNTFQVVENISVHFHRPRRGIIRSIPLRNEVVRLDGSHSRNRAKVSNVHVNEPFTEYKEGNNWAIRIGDPNVSLKGEKTYTLQYTYDIGNDKAQGYDELYFNIIGTDWDTTLDNVYFVIHMPKSFDESKLGFSVGALDATSSENIEYSVEGNTIRGSHKGTLKPGEGLTLRLELPEGYFAYVSPGFDFWVIPAFLFPLLFFFLFYRTWKKYGQKRGEVVETVEFYPPDGLNSAEVAFWHDGLVSSKDIVSLLIYLANKGYIKIAEREAVKEGFFKTQASATGFKVTKIKEYDGENANEKKFLQRLFQEKKSRELQALISIGYNIKKPSNAELEETSVHEVSDLDLRNTFYATLSEIASDMNKRENRDLVFETTSRGKNLGGFLMVYATYFCITLGPVLQEGMGSEMLVVFLFPSIAILVFLFAIFFLGGLFRWMLFLWGALFGGVPWALLVLPVLRENAVYMVANILGFAGILALVFFMKNMKKRTPLGNERLGKIRGFKHFLETAEKPKLEALVLENPQYFYNILPYTYVLGLSDTWIKKFESIAMPPPGWYSGRSSFSNRSLGSFVRSTMQSASSAMRSSPSSGGSHSGGGSSGRGSGGGGGRSW